MGRRYVAALLLLCCVCYVGAQPVDSPPNETESGANLLVNETVTERHVSEGHVGRPQVNETDLVNVTDTSAHVTERGRLQVNETDAHVTERLVETTTEKYDKHLLVNEADHSAHVTERLLETTTEKLDEHLLVNEADHSAHVTERMLVNETDAHVTKNLLETTTEKLDEHPLVNEADHSVHVTKNLLETTTEKLDEHLLVTEKDGPAESGSEIRAPKVNATMPVEGRRSKQADEGRRSGAPCPCDQEFGLKCSPETRSCHGPLSLEVIEVGARSARVRWRSSAGLEPQAQVSIAEPNGPWTKIQGGGGEGVSLNSLLPGHAYWVRVEEDGRHEAAEFNTAHEPKVLVRALGPTSLTVAWDDFRPSSPTSHYVLLYRGEEGGDWQQVQAGSRTLVSLSGLSPDAGYEMRVAAFEDGRQVDASEQVTARTQDGCVWSGRSLLVGEAVPQEKGAECAEECACSGRNQTSCRPRCAAPLFLRGASGAHDPSCYEAPQQDGDPCCAELRCPESKFYGDDAGAQNKSGECPELVSDSSCLSDCDSDADCAHALKCCPSACGGALCVPPATTQTCDHVACGPNAECDAGACRCEPGFRGDPQDLAEGCTAASTEAPFHLNLANDEDNFHLNRTGVLSDGCVFGNATFPRGAHFDAGCEARCTCEGRGRVTCAPRCSRGADEELAPGCALRPDPEDPQCCTIAECAFPGVRVVSAEAVSGSAVRVRVDPPSSEVGVWVRSMGGEWMSAGGGTPEKGGALEIEGLIPATHYELRVTTANNETSNTVQVKTLPRGSRAGACVHEGRPLAVGEELEVGCEHRCVCREGGLLECRDRCQVWVDTVGLEHCEWRPAPDDPCCTVPVCPPVPPNLLPFPTGGVMGGPRCEGEEGASYRVGDIWERGDGCRTLICRCGVGGVQCTSECPPARCPAHLLQPPTPDCPCPACAPPPEHPPPTTTPPGSPGACEFRGVPYAPGAEFRDGCGARCVCGTDLRVQCAPLRCPPPPETCLEWDDQEDPCCPKCKQIGCVSEGGAKRRPLEKWAGEEGRQCECLEGGRVRCCPRVPQRFLAPTERCPRPVVVTPDDPNMCPYVVCNNTQHGGGGAPEEEENEQEPRPQEAEDLRAVSVVALNSTAVRVRFSLPPSLVGARGWAELRFSPDPALEEGAWRAQRFSRPRRLFDSPHIEYVLGAGLDAGQTYYMRVRVKPDAPIPAPHDSALFKVTMPPPAAVTVDVRPLHAQPLPGGRSALVSWRPLAAREKRLVDALLLQWKREEGGSSWEESPPLHRDTSEWELRNLQPNSAYELRIVLRGEEGAPALEAAPGNTLRFTTHNATAEEVVASVMKVGGSSASFSVSPLPQGAEARAVRVKWGRAGDSAPHASYAAPPNDTQPAVLEGLTPNTKYWAQLEVFLSDGRALASNKVEFSTAEAENLLSQESRTSTAEEESGGGVGALVAVAVVCGAAALAFALLLVVVVRRRGAAAPISRTPSEAAYDNPTYKTYDGERPLEEPKVDLEK